MNQTVNIKVREDGSRVVTRNFKGMGDQGDKTTAVLNKMKLAVQAVFAGAIIRQIQQMLDTYTKIQTQLRLTTNGQANLNAVFNELVEVSRRTRSSLETNAELYSRIALSTKDLGISQKEVIQFTESLNKTVKLSGATAIEAENAIVQLTQGLASGTLRGDELRAVLEQLPAVADVIAKGMGITRGELRKFGEQGKISADEVLKAFRDAREEIDERFSKTTPTIAEGFQAIKNQLLVTVGAIDQATGSSSLLAGGLVWVADALKALTPELVNFTRAITGTLDPMDEMSDAGKVIASIFVTVYGVFKSVGALLMGAVLIAFKTVGKVVGGVVAAVQQVLSGDLKAAYRTVQDLGREVFTTFGDEAQKAGDTAVNATSDMFTKLDQIWNKGARQQQDRRALIVGEVSDQAGPRRVKPKVNAKEEASARKLNNELRQLLNTIDPISGAKLELAKATDILQRAADKELITIDEQLQYLDDLGLHYEKIMFPLQEFNRQLDEQTAISKLNSREREVEQQVLSASQDLLERGVKLSQEDIQMLRVKFQAVQKLNEVMAEQDRLLGESVDKRRAFITQVQAIQNLLADPKSGFGQSDATNAIAQILPEGTLEGTQQMVQAQIDALAFRQEQIDYFHTQGLLSEEAYQTAIAKLNADRFTLQTNNTKSFFGALAGLTSSGNSKLFKIGKAAAIAEATISGTQAVMNAMAVKPWYVGAALAVAQAVTTANQIAQIKNAKPPTGFMSGGYTGDGPMNQVAGNVHNREFVMNAAATSRIGVRNLEALQNGDAGVATRSSRSVRGGTANGGVNVEIKNYGTSKEFQVQQLSEHEIRVIARDEAKGAVAKDAPGVIAQQLTNPNSVVSKAQTRHTQTERRR